jgi:FKBP-type peptidyl-prolyl cis-trans isomerase
MKKGGKATFYCPSQMAYGHTPRVDSKTGKENIPANSILIFEITLNNFL